MKTFRRFYGDILEQVGLVGNQASPVGGNDPTAIQARKAQERALQADIILKRKLLQKSKQIKEQLTPEQLKARQRERVLQAQQNAERQRQERADRQEEIKRQREQDKREQEIIKRARMQG